MFMVTNQIFRSFWMKNHFFLFHLPLRKMLLLTLATFFYWPLPFFRGISERQDWPRSSQAGICDQLLHALGGCSSLPAQGAGAGTWPLCPPPRKGISPGCRAWRVGFLQPCMWDGDLMLSVWEWHFCLWTHDLVAVGLAQVVSVWDHDLGWVSWPSLGTGLVLSANVGRRVTHMNSGKGWKISTCPLSSPYVTPHWGETLPKYLKDRTAQSNME